MQSKCTYHGPWRPIHWSKHTKSLLKTERAGERFCIAIQQGHISDRFRILTLSHYSLETLQGWPRHCTVHINTALTNHKHWSWSTGWCFSCEETNTHKPLFILHFHNHIFYTESKHEKLLNANSKRQDYTFRTLFSKFCPKKKEKLDTISFAMQKWTLTVLFFA